MQHLTFADKSLLLGDEAARILLEYAAALATHDQADTVSLSAINSDGNEVIAHFLLNAGSPLMTESASTTAAEPENAMGVDYMRTQLRLILTPPNVVVEGGLASGIDFDRPAGDGS